MEFQPEFALMAVVLFMLVMAMLLAMYREYQNRHKYVLDGVQRRRWIDPTEFFAEKRRVQEEKDMGSITWKAMRGVPPEEVEKEFEKQDVASAGIVGSLVEQAPLPKLQRTKNWVQGEDAVSGTESLQWASLTMMETHLQNCLTALLLNKVLDLKAFTGLDLDAFHFSCGLNMASADESVVRVVQAFKQSIADAEIAANNKRKFSTIARPRELMRNKNGANLVMPPRFHRVMQEQTQACSVWVPSRGMVIMSPKEADTLQLSEGQGKSHGCSWILPQNRRVLGLNTRMIQQALAPIDKETGSIDYMSFLHLPGVGYLLDSIGVTELLAWVEPEDKTEAMLRQRYEDAAHCLHEAHIALNQWKLEWYDMPEEQRLVYNKRYETVVMAFSPTKHALETPRERAPEERIKLRVPQTAAQKKKHMQNEIRKQQAQKKLMEQQFSAGGEARDPRASYDQYGFSALVAHNYARFDLDGSGSLNSREELLQLTTTLACQLQLRVKPAEIVEKVNRVLIDDSNVWDSQVFDAWFRVQVYQPALEPIKKKDLLDKGLAAPLSQSNSTASLAGYCSPQYDEFEQHLERLFRRYDLDNSGTINSSQEFYQLVTNLCWAMHPMGLSVTTAELQAKVNAVGQISDQNAKCKLDVQEWFLRNFEIPGM